MSSDSSNSQQLQLQSSVVDSSSLNQPQQLNQLQLNQQQQSSDSSNQLHQQSQQQQPQLQLQPQLQPQLHYQQVQQPGMLPYQQQQQQQQYPISYGSTTAVHQGNGQASTAAATAARPYLGYPDQYQQYLQSVQQMGGSTSNVLQSTGGGAMPAGSTLASAYQASPYSYYMMNQQAASSIPSQQQVSQQHPQQSLQQQQQPDYSSYAYRGYVPSYPPAMYPSSVSGVPSMAAPLSYTSALTSTVGQVQPAGLRPRITTTMWEDEKTLCYQVDANGISVVRRADNNMINGTKLLNVAKMTRGRRDGILKSEKVRKVVKIGSMHLKGVWIPFERALAMAQREGIVDLLYPLFVKDIKRVIQQGTPTTPANGSTTSTVSANNGGTTSNSGNGSTSHLQQQQQQQQHSQPQQQPLTSNANSSTAIPTASSYGNYSSMYYPSQLSAATGNNGASATTLDKLDSKDSRPQQQQQPYGYYPQQQQPPQQQQQQSYGYYYTPQMQQQYSAYGYATAAANGGQVVPSVAGIGSTQDGQPKLEPK